MKGSGSNRQSVQVRVKDPPPKITLKRVRRQFQVEARPLTQGIPLDSDAALRPENTNKYRLTRTQQEGLAIHNQGLVKRWEQDITHIREKQVFSKLMLVAAIARYLNQSPLFVEQVLAHTQEGSDRILAAVNTFNELLYDWVIPHLFQQLYHIQEDTTTEEYEVELVKLSKDGYYSVSADPDLIVTEQLAGADAAKSFHLDHYCFDSSSERTLFWNLLRAGKVKRLYFTGMLTHGQSDFYIQYIDPDTHAIRIYYPNFLVEKDNNTYVIIEVKGDHKIENPVVQAKRAFAEQVARDNQMTYRIMESSRADAGEYSSLLQ